MLLNKTPKDILFILDVHFTVSCRQDLSKHLAIWVKCVFDLSYACVSVCDYIHGCVAWEDCRSQTLQLEDRKLKVSDTGGLSLSVLGIRAGVLYMLGGCSISTLHPPSLKSSWLGNQHIIFKLLGRNSHFIIKYGKKKKQIELR